MGLQENESPPPLSAQIMPSHALYIPALLDRLVEARPEHELLEGGRPEGVANGGRATTKTNTSFLFRLSHESRNGIVKQY